MNQITTDAIILKRLNFSEADRILTVLTPEHGRMSLLAKGVRKQKSKLAGGLELFSISTITFIDGRSELKTIISTRLKKHYRHIVEDVTKTLTLYDYLKAIDILTQHGVEAGMYGLLNKILEYLDDAVSHTEVATVWFVTQLLKIDGRAINVEKPINARDFSESVCYEFSYDDMGFLEHERGSITPNHIKFLRLVQRAANPKKLHTITGYDVMSQNLESICMHILKINKA